MSNLKCPFCQQELDCMGKYTDGSSKWLCNKCGLFGDKRLFDEIIYTHKALEIAKDTFNWIDETYRTGQEMESEIWGKVQLTAQEITALEQKDVK